MMHWMMLLDTNIPLNHQLLLKACLVLPLPSPCSTEIGPDNETQDMSGAAEPDVTNVPSPMSSSSTTSRNSLNTDASNEGHHADNKSKTRKWSKS